MRQTDPLLHPDRLLPAEPGLRAVARTLYDSVAAAPLVSPHGHCEASWFASDAPFPNATDLLILPDHYVLRMLVSQGVGYDDLGIARTDGTRAEVDPREAWRLFARHYHLFLGTPSRLWLDHAMHDVLGVPERLTAASADAVYDHINAQLATPAFRPRALFESFNLEVLATTDAATDDLAHHGALKAEGYRGIIPTFRPDAVTNPHHPAFAASMARLAEQTGKDVANWQGYLDALADRRAVFAELGATATDHGVLHPTTLDLPASECQSLLDGAHAGTLSVADAHASRRKCCLRWRA
jgi:glucuronate isomerase